MMKMMITNRSTDKKIMRHTTLYGITAMTLLVLLSSACSDDEEALTPNAPFIDKFDVPVSATGAEADLRRDFYARNGCYIIFNDTLSAVRDASGNLKVETVDFEWNLTTSGRDTDERELFETIDDQREAAAVMEKYILPYIKDGAMKPHAVMPFKSIMTSKGKVVDYKESWRCLGINFADIMSTTDEAGRKTVVMEIIKKIYKSKVSYSAEKVDTFHEICEEYSGEYISDYFPEWEDERDMEIIYSLGYISYKTNKKPANEKFLTQSNDYTDFVNLVFDKTPEEVYEMYGRYEKIILKYEMVRSLVNETGIKI